MRARLDAVMDKGLARLFLVETEHELVLREAELAWVRELVREIRNRTLGGMAEWESFHSARDATDVEKSKKEARA